MTDVDREDSFEVSSINDQDPVETFATYGADPPFDERVRAGCPYRCLDDLDAFACEDGVEVAAELAIAVADQEAKRRSPLLHVAACFAGRRVDHNGTMLRALAIGIAIALIVFALSGGHIFFLPLLFLPIGLFGFGHRRNRRSRFFL